MSNSHEEPAEDALEEQDDSPRIRSSRNASTALFLGVVAMISSTVLVGGLIGIIAIGLGTRGLKQIEAGSGKLRGKGMAITGIIFGTLSLIAAMVALAIYTRHHPNHIP